jgi:hypothetical protein
VLPFCFGVLAWCVQLVIGNVLLFLFHFLAFLCLFGITDAILFFPDLPADTWQLHDGCVSGLLGPDQEALNSSVQQVPRSLVIVLQVPFAGTSVVTVVLLRM